MFSKRLTSSLSITPCGGSYVRWCCIYASSDNINRSTHFQTRLIASAFHKTGKSSGQFGDTVSLPAPDRLFGNQLSPDSQCHGPGKDEIDGGLLIHPSGGNE